MKRAQNGAAALFLCCAMFLFPAFHAFAAAPTITAATADCVVAPGADCPLSVAVQGVAPYSCLWEVSADGGATWSPIPGAADLAYTVTGAQPNAAAQTPYLYRVTVTDAGGMSAQAQIRVLVSDAYTYRKIALRNGIADVSAYLRSETRLTVTQLDSGTAPAALMNALSAGHLPLILCDIALADRSSQQAPYFGALQLDFHVGSTYEGQTLTVRHLTGGSAAEHSAVVAGGILSVSVNTLSPFLVGVPAASAHTVTVSAGPGGSALPAGAAYVPDGEDQTLTFLPDTGYAIESVTLGGVPVAFSGNSLTLTGVAQDESVGVSFRQVAPSQTLHSVSVSGGAHGSVSPSGAITVRHGGAQTIYFYPDADYELDTVQVDHVPVSVTGR